MSRAIESKPGPGSRKACVEVQAPVDLHLQGMNSHAGPAVPVDDVAPRERVVQPSLEAHCANQGHRIAGEPGPR